MRRYCLVGMILLSPVIATAGTYTVSTTAAQDTRLDRARLRVNAETCASVNLPASCTQAQARAINPALDVFSDIEDFITRFLLKNAVQDLKRQQDGSDRADFCVAFNAASPSAQAAACSAVSATACVPCVQ
jgi:hypothetical protein